MNQIDFERRFGGVRKLYGAAGLAALQQAHVCVIGIGGVGSWAAEALARFDAHEGALRPQFAYGALGKSDYAVAHGLHIANHRDEVVAD